MRHFIGALGLILLAFPALAESAAGGAVSMVQSLLQSFTHVLEAVLFFPVFGFPFLVLWLIGAGVYFTLRLGFVNMRFFAHGIQVARGKYHNAASEGEISPFAALSSAVAGTAGLGNIAGVAVAIVVGGPGAVIWMIVAGLLGMSTIFAEVVLGQVYRIKDDNGQYTGGPFQYLRRGLKEHGREKLGKVLGVVFAVFCIGGSLGGGNMLQSNQLTAVMVQSFPVLSGWVYLIALVSAISVAVVLIGGVKRLGQVAEAIVPFMALIYLSAGCVILFIHAYMIPEALMTMLKAAFGWDAAAGGVVGAMIQGFRRSAFSNEAGVGSTPIVFSATKTEHPVAVASMAVVAPFVDTLVVCLMTGLIIIVTGVYQAGDVTGVVLTGRAFASVADWFPHVLTLCVVLFAFSTMLTWSYYGERAWGFLFGYKKLWMFHLLFCSLTFFGGAMQDESNAGFNMIVDLGDLLLLAMALPNLIGVYLMQKVVVGKLREYQAMRKSGAVKPLHGG